MAMRWSLSARRSSNWRRVECWAIRPMNRRPRPCCPRQQGRVSHRIVQDMGCSAPNAPCPSEPRQAGPAPAPTALPLPVASRAAAFGTKAGCAGQCRGSADAAFRPSPARSVHSSIPSRDRATAPSPSAPPVFGLSYPPAPASSCASAFGTKAGCGGRACRTVAGSARGGTETPIASVSVPGSAVRRTARWPRA